MKVFSLCHWRFRAGSVESFNVHSDLNRLQLKSVEHLELFCKFIGTVWSHGLQHKLIFAPTSLKLLCTCTKVLRSNANTVSEEMPSGFVNNFKQGEQHVI